MNKMEWIGVLGILVVIVIMLTGCVGYDLVWDKGI
jgi:uncharacterized membrane protein